jgi:hypothetical protein
MFIKAGLLAFAVLSLLGLAAGAQAQAQRAAGAASAASAAQDMASSANRRQLLAACKKKVMDAGLTGEEAKKAMFDCMRKA